MADMNVRSDSVDVEQIMRQIRARIREKRGADYTEAELQQLATVKLEKFLDPRGVRSDLVEQFRSQRDGEPGAAELRVRRGDAVRDAPRLLRTIRRLLRPILKLFFNPDPITTALHIQTQVNTQAEQRLRQLEEWTALLRADPQPDARDHAARHRSAQPEDARRVAVEPAWTSTSAARRSLESVVQYRPAPPRQAQSASLRPAAVAGTAAAAPRRARRHAGSATVRRRPGRTRRAASRAGVAAGAGAAARGQTMADGSAGRLAEPQPGRAGRGRQCGRTRDDGASDSDATESSDGPYDADGPDGPDDSDQ